MSRKKTKKKESYLTLEDINRDFKEAEQKKKKKSSNASSAYANYSISSWTSDSPTESPVLYRKMSSAEAGRTFSGQGLVPPRKGDHRQKYLTEDKEKAQGFTNRRDETPEKDKVTVRIKLDKEKYSQYRESLVHQTGARGSKNDHWHREGLSGNKGTKGTAPSKDPINVGVKRGNIPNFNNMTQYGSVKKVKPKK